MIDLCQWRASIGLWHCCKATRNCCHLIETVGDSKPGSSEFISGQKHQLTAIMSFIICLLAQLLRELLQQFFIAGKGVIDSYYSKVKDTSGDTVHAVNWLQSIPNNCISLFLYFLLLLSGDIELNPGPVTGNARDILRSHFSGLIVGIAGNMLSITNDLYASGLITSSSKEEIAYSHGQSEYTKAEKLLNDVNLYLASFPNPNQYLANVCQVLIKQQDQRLAEIATDMLQQLDESTIPTVEKMLNIIDLSEVLGMLRNFSASKWLDLGLHLGLYYHTLEFIERNNKDSTRCLLNCLAKWLERHDRVDQFGAPTWTSLASALEKMGEMAVAESIRMEKIKFQQNSVSQLGVAKATLATLPAESEASLGTADLNNILTLLEKSMFCATEWFELGLKLGLYNNTLKVIKKNDQEVKSCLRSCLVKWLERADDVDEKGGASWTTLANALEANNQKASASYIRANSLDTSTKQVAHNEDPATSAAAVADNPLPSDTQQQVYINQDTTTGEVGSITQGPIVINVLPSTTPAKEDGNKFLTKVVLALFIVVILLLLRYVPIGQASILF